VSEDYAGQQVVGIDLHRRRSVIVRMTESGRLIHKSNLMTVTTPSPSDVSVTL
jgi:hypothetical protein